MIYFGWFFFRPLVYRGGTLNTAPPTKVRLNLAPNSNIIPRPGKCHSPTTRTGMDANTEATAGAVKVGWAHLRPAPVPRATFMPFFLRDQPAYVAGTGTTGATFSTPPPTLPQAPATGARSGSLFPANGGTYPVPLYTRISIANQCSMLRCTWYCSWRPLETEVSFEHGSS